MEEKEILNEVNGSGKDKVRRILMYIGWGLSAVLLVNAPFSSLYTTIFFAIVPFIPAM